MHLEIVGAGGLGVTIITGVLAGQFFDSALAQGISVIGVGAIIVFTSIAISRKDNAVT
jgi:glucan phosphorylase